MIDVKILRQQIELGATPERIVELVEQMLAEEAADLREWEAAEKRGLRSPRPPSAQGRLP